MTTGTPGDAKHVGPYALIRELGRGGVGVVHEAHDPSGRTVALKLLLETSEVALKRFEREAHALGALSHPNIVRVHSCGQSSRGPYLVTELVPGEGLDHACAHGPPPPERAADIVRQLADAVARAHAAGVLHRDLKPQNVILRPDGVPVLLDFGLARHESAETLTRSGALLGTPAYMAPEQAGDGGGGLDERTDVYGLGAILFHLLHGRPPFSASGPMQLVKKVLMDEPEWPSPATAPPELEAVCRKALAKERADRYPTARDLRDDLARVVRGEEPLARPRSRSRPRGLPLALGAAVLLAGVVGAVAFARSRPAVVVAPSSAPARATEPAPPTALESARRALDEARELDRPLAIAEAAARLLDLDPDHVAARRALQESRRRTCSRTMLERGPSSARFVPGADRALVLTAAGSTLQLQDVELRGEPRSILLQGSIGAAAIDTARSCAWTTEAGAVVAIALPGLARVGVPIPLPDALRLTTARAATLSPDGATLALACVDNRTDADGKRASGVVLVDLEDRLARALGPAVHELRELTYDGAGALWALAGEWNDDSSGPQSIDRLRGEVTEAMARVAGTPLFAVEVDGGAMVIGTAAHDLRLLRDGDDERRLVDPLELQRTRPGRSLPTPYDATCFQGRWLVVVAERSEAGLADDPGIAVYDLADAPRQLATRRWLTPAWSIPIPLPDRPRVVDVSADGRLIVVACRDGALLSFPFLPR